MHRNIVEIEPVGTPSIIEWNAFRVSNVTVSVGIDKSVAQIIQVVDGAQFKFCRSDLREQALQAFLDSREKFVNLTFAVTLDNEVEMIVHHHKSNDFHIREQKCNLGSHVHCE